MTCETSAWLPSIFVSTVSLKRLTRNSINFSFFSHQLPRLFRFHDEISLSASVTVLAVVLTGLRLSKSFCFGDGVYLRHRVLLLEKIRGYVLRWEATCVAEVQASCADVDRQAIVVLSRHIGRSAAQRVEAELAAERVNDVLPFQTPVAPPASFSGIGSSFSFSKDIALEDMLEVAYMADSVLRLAEDRQWLERFVTILQYVLFRRVSQIEEVRLYRRIFERAIFPGIPSRQKCSQSNHGNRGMASSTWAGAWRVYYRPTWLAPLSGGTQFLCLPLSYFPIEAVLPYLACETWLNERLLGKMLPQWERLCVRALRRTGTSSLSVPLLSKGAPAERASKKVHYWFLRYTAPHLRVCVDRQRTAARKFSMKELSTATGCEGSAACDLPRNPFGLLWRCLTKTCRYDLPASTRCASVPGAPRKTSGTSCGGSEESEEKKRLARRALLLRAASQALVTTFQVCCPRLSVRYVTEVLITGSILQRRGTSLSDEVTAAEGSESLRVDALLRSMAVNLGSYFLAAVTEVLLSRFISVTSAHLILQLTDAALGRLHQELLCVDEAFYSRWIRTVPHEGGNMGGTSSAALPGGRLSPTTTPRLHSHLTVDDVLAVGRGGGERIIALHDAMVKRTLRYAVLVGRAAVTCEWRPLIGAVIMVCVKVPSLISLLCVAIGYSTPSEVARLLSRKEESLPTRCPVGLRLLQDLLVEVDGDTTVCRGTWLRGRSHLRYPYLALVTCSSIWTFEHLIADTHCGVVSLLSHMRQLKAVYTAVGIHRYAVRPGTRASTAANAITAMQEDVRCVLYYNIYQALRTCEERFAGVAGAASPRLHRLLDAEETALLQQPQALSYLPAHVDYYELFSLPYRFILRQLGLEMVFAYRAATGMQQDSRQMAEEWWTQTLFNSPFNPLALALHETAQLTASCATVLLLCSRIVDWSWVVCPIPLPALLRQAHTMQMYRDMLLSVVAVERLEDGLASLQQLSEHLPHAIVSEIPLSTLRPRIEAEKSDPVAPLSALQQRRRHWRQVLSSRRAELFFDVSDRIVGGLRLRSGVSWHHVYFAYPQLFATPSARDLSLEKGKVGCGVRPTLTDVCCACPAVGMTAVIGPSGAGKSSLNLLLRRLYDPIAVIECNRGCTTERSALEEPQPVYVDLNYVGTAVDAEDVLVEVLRLALVESALPPPSMLDESFWHLLDGSSGHGGTSEVILATSASLVSSPHYRLRVQPGYIALDGIPLSLFSPAYVRQWFSWLPQTAHVQPRQSFLSNVRGTAFPVTIFDIERALRMCGCLSFMEEKHRTLQDAVGSLSSGENQRLALASVVAALFARCRLELLHGVSFPGPLGVTVPADAAIGGLVLDEPTSHLDAANEHRLLAALEKLQGKTDTAECNGEAGLPLFVWIISHRMSTLWSARHMVVMEHGRVTASGPSAEVTKTSFFAKIQMKLQRLDEDSTPTVVHTAH